MVEAYEESGKSIEHYALLKQLGDGQFGAAYLALDTATKKHVAIKIFKELDAATQKTFEAEVTAGTSGLKHENVIKLHAAGRSDFKVNGEAQSDVFYIVMELAANGESFDYVEAAGGLEDRYARQLFGQLIEGLSYIHKMNIAHRDLKLENCFLDKDCRMKIADFGLQKAFAGEGGQELRTRCGTPNYMAPELLGGKDPYDGPAVDIFACGAILFILRYAKFAFAASNDSYYRRLHRNPQQAMIDRNIKASPEFLNLIVGLTQLDPKKRLTLEQVKNHPWMKGPTAKPNEVRAHYYSLVPGRKCLNKDHYNAMQLSRKEWAVQKKIERGSDVPLKYNKADLESWCIDNALSELKYKDFNEDRQLISCQNGFYTDTAGESLFIALYEHFALKDLPANDMIEVDSYVFKCKFTVTANVMDEINDDGEDDKPENEESECQVTATIKCVEENEQNEENPAPLPKLMYMAFKRKSGCRMVYGNFLREIKESMKHFQVFAPDVPQQEEELVEQIANQIEGSDQN